MGSGGMGVGGTGPGGKFRPLVWVDRVVRRGGFENRPTEAIVAGAVLEAAECVKTFTVNSSISFRVPGAFAKVWGLVKVGALSKEAFLEHYSATNAFKVHSMKLPHPVSVGA